MYVYVCGASSAILSASTRLLTLGVKILRGRLSKSSLGSALLRERIYNATFDFFWWVERLLI